jgi:L-ascorbate metabolism protein UlaG (beta-lactamase superfamily)
MVAQFSVEFVGHATAIIRVDNLRLLCDPHFGQTFRRGLFGFFPARRVRIGRLPQIDAIVLSHSHRDHYDLASLSVLDRTIPVFCPADNRILYGLRRLGFSEVIVVGDWSILRMRGVALLWTPSTYRVPELGLAIAFNRRTLWNLVDTHVERSWARRVMAELGVDRIDVLLAPCQQLIETDSVESIHPAVPRASTTRAMAVIRETRPRIIVPFADGHFCSNAAAWMNRHKFPFSQKAIEKLVRSVSSSELVWPEPGRNVDVIAFQTARGGNRCSKPLHTHQVRTFHPGAEIGPLTSVRPLRPNAIRRLFARKENTPIGQELIHRYGDGLVFEEAVYCINVVGRDGRRGSNVLFRIDREGRTRRLRRALPDVEIAITSDDLHELLRMRLGFSAALLGGRIREYRHSSLCARIDAFVTGEHDAIKRSQRVAFSGLCAINLLMRRASGGPMAEIEAEVRAIESHRPWSPLPAKHLKSSSKPVRVGTSSAGSLWRRADEALHEHGDLASISGAYPWKGKDAWVGVFGRAKWPKIEGPIPRKGVLLPINLVEAQPHMGSGVRFPADSYERFLENILESPIQDWYLEAGIPSGLSVSRWRQASLFPLHGERLRRDLRARGWHGTLRQTLKSPVGPEWWLGVPRVRDVQSQKLSIRVGGGEALGFRGSRPIAGEPEFRIEFPATAQQRRLGLLAMLVEAGFRYSWTLQPDETYARFPDALECGYEMWSERVCLSALREMLSRNMKRSHK